MAQQARVEITAPAIRIDDVSGGILGHGVDGQVATAQVVFEFHVRRKLGGKAAVAGSDLALEPRQRVFFLGPGVQEYREVASHRNESSALELAGRGAHDHPVALLHLAAEKAIPDRAAHQVHLHGRMLTDTRPWALLAACLTLSGCYATQAARGQLQILNAREPITRVLEDPKASSELKQRLETVRAARDFASRELGLPNNKSYTSYADLKREYVVWSVVATPEFSVEPKEWCFPIVGCVAYRGYFKEAKAQEFAGSLRREGFDAVVEGVPAYSTLGKFNDPIMSTMMSYGDDELASIMFHELSHQVVYIADDTSFNEAFAVTVEQEGLARWLKQRGRPADLARYRARRERQAESIRIVARYRDQLKNLYSSGLAPEAMRRRKSEVFAALVAELKAADARHGVKSLLAGELEGAANNARLASLATYYDCVPGFERVLAEQQHDLPRFYAAVRELSKLPRDARRAQLCVSGQAP